MDVLELMEFLKKLDDLAFNESGYPDENATCSYLDDEAFFDELLLCADAQGWITFKLQ